MNNKASKWTCEDGKYVCDHDCDKAKIACPLVPEKQIEAHYKSSPTSDEGLRQEIATVIWETGASYFTGDEVDASVDKILLLIAGKDELSKVDGWQEVIKKIPVIQKCHVFEPDVDAVAKLCYKAGYEAGQEKIQKVADAWWWQDDGEDDLESLTCPILIEAHQLRNLIEQARTEGMQTVVEFTRHKHCLTWNDPDSQQFLKSNGLKD